MQGKIDANYLLALIRILLRKSLILVLERFYSVCVRKNFEGIFSFTAGRKRGL
jgi:hypothetical protein